MSYGEPVIRCRAILFDLDGVLVDSRATVEHVWRQWAARGGLDPAPFLRVALGRRTSETLREAAPDLDIAAATAELDALEERTIEGLVAAPGARPLVSALPADRWGIVTSGSRTVAALRLQAARLPRPRVFVTGDMVRHGKPDPEGYRAGIAALGPGIAAADCLAFEDSPAGVQAAAAAGLRVVAVLAAGRPPAEAVTVVHALHAVSVARDDAAGELHLAV